MSTHDLEALANDVAAHIWTDILKARGDYTGWFEDKAAAGKLILAALLSRAEPGEPGFVCVNCGKELKGIAYCGECNALPSIGRPAPDALREAVLAVKAMRALAASIHARAPGESQTEDDSREIVAMADRIINHAALAPRGEGGRKPDTDPYHDPTVIEMLDRRDAQMGERPVPAAPKRYRYQCSNVLCGIVHESKSFCKVFGTCHMCKSGQMLLVGPVVADGSGEDYR